jgi:hypothetical protein
MHNFVCSFVSGTFFSKTKLSHVMGLMGTPKTVRFLDNVTVM